MGVSQSDTIKLDTSIIDRTVKHKYLNKEIDIPIKKIIKTVTRCKHDNEWKLLYRTTNWNNKKIQKETDWTHTLYMSSKLI